MIFESVLSANAAVASISIAPCLLIEAAKTFMPGPLSTGMDSPVTGDSSRLDWPAVAASIRISMPTSFSSMSFSIPSRVQCQPPSGMANQYEDVLDGPGNEPEMRERKPRTRDQAGEQRVAQRRVAPPGAVETGCFMLVRHLPSLSDARGGGEYPDNADDCAPVAGAHENECAARSRPRKNHVHAGDAHRVRGDACARAARVRVDARGARSDVATHRPP